MQRLDGQAGAVSWEYYSHDGSLSEAAVHPDGTVFVTDRDYEVTTSLVALDGETGVMQRWTLPWEDHQAFATGPIVRADGRVVVLSDPRDGSCTRLDLVELESPTAGGLTVTDVTLATPDCYFHPDDYRLLPDGADGLLLAQRRDGASVRRLGADGIVSDRTDLVSPQAGLPVIEAEYVVGDTVAHARVTRWTGLATNTYTTAAVTFDPATLTVDSTTDLGADPYVRLRFLDRADAVHYSGPPGGAARPLGGEVGPHDTQVAAGLWAALGSGPALMEGPVVDTYAPSTFVPGGLDSTNGAAHVYPISVRCRPVDDTRAWFFGALHCYIVTRDRNGLSREDLVRALGRGIGATGAHELGHQWGLDFVRNVACDDCYDSESAVTHSHFFGPKHWSVGARDKMRRVLPPR